MTDSVREHLESIEFLWGMPADAIRSLADCGDLLEYSPNQTIFREGDEASDIYFISRGAVTLEMCSPGKGCRQVLSLGEGDLLGWSAALVKPSLTATARAVSEALLVRLPSQQLFDLCERDHLFGYHFMRRTAAALAVRLSSARLQFLDIYQH